MEEEREGEVEGDIERVNVCVCVCACVCVCVIQREGVGGNKSEREEVNPIFNKLKGIRI